ncbi:hypothetical protein KCP73_21740 [Salmonella enterica subsp. enterica]|nr:hypothetical protein KCP73_21740 [Salmonella enterica subsp. enterica]
MTSLPAAAVTTGTVDLSNPLTHRRRCRQDHVSRGSGNHPTSLPVLPPSGLPGAVCT